MVFIIRINFDTYNDFEKVDIQAGTIIEAHDFPEARKPAYQLLIDFGAAIGIKRSSAQITQHYSKSELVGKRVLAIVNFPEKRIGSFISQVFTWGLPDEQGNVVLVSPDHAVPNRCKIILSSI